MNRYFEKVAEIVARDLVPGGEADYRPTSEFDAEQLIEGAEHELEHTDNFDLAVEIAKDHIKDIPDYYERLEEMEEEAEDEMGGGEEEEEDE